MLRSLASLTLLALNSACAAGDSNESDTTDPFLRMLLPVLLVEM